MTKKMTKDECCEGKDEDCCCGEDATAMSLEQVVQNNNLMINVLVEALLEKKIISEDDIKKKLAEVLGPME